MHARLVKNVVITITIVLYGALPHGLLVIVQETTKIQGNILEEIGPNWDMFAKNLANCVEVIFILFICTAESTIIFINLDLS